MTTYKIGIIGAGNLGSHLSRAFSKAGHKIVVFTRRGATHLLSDVKGLVWTEHLSSFRRGFDFIIIAVNDDGIDQVASEINPEEGIVLHTSGSTSIKILEKNKIKNCGVFYPLQSFKKDLKQDYKKIPVFIEGNSSKNLEKIKKLASEFSDHVKELNSEERKKLHLAGVVVNNFTNHLYHLAQHYISEIDITFDHLLPLIKDTTKRVEMYSPKDMQTGPARRKDQNIIKEHIALLENNPEFQEVYKVISKSIEKSFKTS